MKSRTFGCRQTTQKIIFNPCTQILHWLVVSKEVLFLELFRTSLVISDHCRTFCVYNAILRRMVQCITCKTSCVFFCIAQWYATLLLCACAVPCCSADWERQGWSSAVLSPETTGRRRRRWRPPGHCNSDETLLGRGTGRKTVVWRRCQISEDRQQRKVGVGSALMYTRITNFV